MEVEVEVVPSGSGEGRGRHENHGGLQPCVTRNNKTNECASLASRTLVKVSVLFNIYERAKFHTQIYRVISNGYVTNYRTTCNKMSEQTVNVTTNV